MDSARSQSLPIQPLRRVTLVVRIQSGRLAQCLLLCDCAER